MTEALQRTTLYRIRVKGRLNSPAEEECIRQIFRNEGIDEEPTFDRYLFRYEWN